jgi:hypothetical protein
LGALVFSAFSGQSARADFDAQCAYIFDATANLAKVLNFASYEHPYYNSGISNEVHLTEKQAPWTGNHFLFQSGGIASRWQRKDTVPTRLLSEDQNGKELPRDQVLKRIQSLSQSELNSLSPAEKMDIFLGNYDFSITRTELEKRGPRRPMPPQHWEGFCNGLSAAAISQPEPVHPVTRTNVDGVTLEFEPGDIKALLQASYFYVEKYAQVGSPSSSNPADDDPTQKLDAGAFDVAITRYLGNLKKPFVLDIDPGAEIWNYVAVGYKRSVSPPETVKTFTDAMPRATVSVAHVNITVDYADDLDATEANTPTKARVAAGELLYSRTYQYDLYLNSEDQILGGTFTSKDHPDMMWFPGGKGTDESMGMNPELPFSAVEKLDKAAQ